MGDGHEKAAATDAMFELPAPLAHGARAKLTDGGRDLCYGNSIRVSKAIGASGRTNVRTWNGRFHAAPGATSGQVQICCSESACRFCQSVPPCTGGVEPLIEGDKQIEMAAALRKDRTAGVDELVLPDGKRIPILGGDGLELQLKPWHDAVFGAARTVVYHLYFIDSELSQSGMSSPAIVLDGKVIAIPVKPTPIPVKLSVPA